MTREDSWPDDDIDPVEALLGDTEEPEPFVIPAQEPLPADPGYWLTVAAWVLGPVLLVVGGVFGRGPSWLPYAGVAALAAALALSVARHPGEPPRDPDDDPDSGMPW